MAKDLIIGAFSNFKFNHLKPWINSIKETNFSGDIVLIAVDPDPTTVQQIEDAGVKVFKVKNENNMMIHMLRFLHIYHHLKLYGHEYRYVITTDVRDVIFQSNPTEYVQNIFGNSAAGILAQSEAIKIKDEAWNRDNIIKNFGQYFFIDVMENEVYNVGILAGTTEYIRDLCFYLYQMSSNRPDWVADQAAYNMILSYEPWKRIAVKANLESAWACNLHVTNKPDQLEQFGPYLLEPRPIFENGLVLNQNREPFVIVHQYDRVPEMKKYYEEKYGVENVITFNTNN